MRIGMCSNYLFAEPTKHPHSRVLYKLSRQILSDEVRSRSPDEYVLLKARRELAVKKDGDNSTRGPADPSALPKTTSQLLA